MLMVTILVPFQRYSQSTFEVFKSLKSSEIIAAENLHVLALRFFWECPTSNTATWIIEVNILSTI